MTPEEITDRLAGMTNPYKSDPGDSVDALTRLIREARAASTQAVDATKLACTSARESPSPAPCC